MGSNQEHLFLVSCFRINVSFVSCLKTPSILKQVFPVPVCRSMYRITLYISRCLPDLNALSSFVWKETTVSQQNISSLFNTSQWQNYFLHISLVVLKI